jgi:hypothetical protein
MTKTRIGIPLILILAMMVGSCTPKSVNTTISNIAGHGKALMESISIAQNAVIAAEASGLLPTDQARKSIQKFVEAARYGEDAAKLLEQIRQTADSATRQQLIIRVISLLNSVSHTSIGALLPIKVDAVSEDVGKLIAQMNILISTINREVLRP